MTNKILMDVRSNAIVRVVKELDPDTVAVIRLKDKQKYITSKENLKGIKGH